MSQAQELARLRAHLVGFAARRLRDRDQAEDAVQEALLAALEGLERYSGTSSLKTWVTGILKHKIIDCMRASGREEAMDTELAEALGGDPEAWLARRRCLETLERGLAGLPERTAHAFVLREALGLETAEICRRLAVSSSNCWVMLHRARVRLRALASNEV